MPAVAVLAVPDMATVAPADGDSEPTADVAETPDIEEERLGATAPTLDVPSLPVRDTDAPPASGSQTNKSSGANIPQGLLTNSLAAGSGRKSNEITPRASFPFSAGTVDFPPPIQ